MLSALFSNSTASLAAPLAWAAPGAAGASAPASGAAGLPYLIGLALLVLAIAALVLVRARSGAAGRNGRRSRDELRQTEMFYHTLVETIPQMILCKDQDGRFTFANQKFCAELGTSLEALKGKTDFDFFPGELAEKYRADDQRVIESGTVLDVVEQHVTPRGEKLYVQTMKAPLREADGSISGIQGIFWDVTERMRAEEKLKEQNIVLQELARSEHQAHQELKDAQSRLVQSEKLASLGQLVAGVAHEINNPLAFVSNNVAVLERDMNDLVGLVGLYRRARGSTGPADGGEIGAGPENADDAVEISEKIAELSEQLDIEYCLSNLPKIIERSREGLRRIERIVKDLRLFARVDEGEWNEVDLNPGVESAVNMVQGYARKHGVRVVMDFGALPLVRCRAARLQQVVLNLLMNAIDACNEGGTVTVRTRAEAEQDMARIEVSDDGRGINPADRERIFDPFFTTKPIGEGTGLGLSISYGIVKEHRGTIDAGPAPGCGSCFTVRVPVRARRPAEAAAGKAAPETR